MYPVTDNTCKMAWCALLTFLLFNVSYFVQSDIAEYANELHCCYSRYMLNYFQLNGIVFKNTFKVSIDAKDDSSQRVEAPLDAINFYDKRLRSQGIIVLVMLDELRNTTPHSKPPNDLMQVNLYLNNYTGTTRAKLGSTAITPNYIHGYRYFHSIMTDALATFLRDGKCDKYKSMIRDNDQMLKLEEINQLSADMGRLNTDDLQQVLSKLEENKSSLENIFMSTFEKGTYKDFEHRNLLFAPLLAYDYNSWHTSSSGGASGDLLTGDYNMLVKSLIVGDVVTSYKLIEGGYASIHDVMYNVRAMFNQDYVISFQQHVMAAVVHPVFVCFGTYFRVLKKLNSGNNTNVNVLENEGMKLTDTLKSLIGLNIFPKSVQEYLKSVEDKTTEMIKYSYTPGSLSKKGVMGFISEKMKSIQLNSSSSTSFSKRIDLLFNMCSQPMELNNLQFSIDIEGSSSSNNADADELVGNLKKKTMDVGHYVVSLEKHKKLFLTVLNMYDHEYMFSRPPFDLLKRNELGYFAVRLTKRPTKPLITI
ncbi:uncharacterized protein LOC126838720 [Adelges cooleyi]|uniref:uncharacterized protein LOC126838720 n=1 Tax=Adelges cooleyi TaxID=133065 RepID=UPI00217F8774|nr:uncharacterized protein LOC126838720 [Adelges cooleyi]